MQALFAEIERFAAIDVPILIRGESGTGKELVAKAVQRLSRRRDQPFETINCADLTRELLRSELFGHERGAFTGAVSRTAGLVSRVNGGTLFMDEIGELPGDAQAMLLRFLQEGEGRPVGAVRSLTVDVRVIAATHRDLESGKTPMRTFLDSVPLAKEKRLVALDSDVHSDTEPAEPCMSDRVSALTSLGTRP